MSLIDRLKTASAAGVPLVLVTTPDPFALVERIRLGFNGSGPAILQWDCVRGLQGVNQQGIELILSIVPEPEPGTFAPAPGAVLTDAISIVQEKAPEKTILCVHNVHRFLDEIGAVQVVSNARDTFKGSGKMLIMMAPGPKLPAEIQNDVMAMDDPLPSGAEIEAIIDREVSAAGCAFEVEAIDAKGKRAAVDALIGLPAFAVEQSTAMCLTENHAIRSSDLWDRKRGAITQVPGLSMDDGKKNLASMGGIDEIRKFIDDLMNGEEEPAVIVRIDEIEKAMAGAGSDLSGVSTDQLGVMLSSMEDFGWIGSILVGPPGSGKSELSKAVGGTYGRRTLTLDLGAAKGSLVGQSEQQIRAMVKTIVAIAGSSAYFLASCNKLETLPPELKRRFRYGTWFFDLPTKEERDVIWSLQLRAFGLAQDAPRPSDEGWTGAEIRNACELARRLRRQPADVSRYIVPVSQSDPDSIERLRRAAAGKWLSASYAGSYRMPVLNTNPAATSRKYVTE